MGACIGLASQAALAQQPWEMSGKVIYVDDGDTLTILKSDTSRVSIRFSDIDAPETAHGQARPGQPFSNASKRSLEALAKGQQATVTCYEYDSWQRAVCTVYVNGLNVNAEQLRRGMAWANRASKHYVRFPQSYELEAQAKSSGLGLWSAQAPRPVPPWEWRRQCWKLKICAVTGE